MKILVLNSGSSSQKSALYELGDALPSDPPEPLWEASIEWSGGSAKTRIRSLDRKVSDDHTVAADRKSAIQQMLRSLWTGRSQVIRNTAEINMVGHRIVHGGQKLTKATVITPEVEDIISSVAAFAPLHNRAELEGIEIINQLVGLVTQVAVFDTGFHRTLPLPAAVYPGPYEWFEGGIRRYGFHGINHEYCTQRAAQLLRSHLASLRLVSCHLGNGCSLAAISGGESVDTTMGFTPLEGLMMGTRSGSVDPGILTYLLRQNAMPWQQLDDLLNKNSGLLGISGVSGDMREIISALRTGNPRAKLAFDIYVHRLQAGIASMVAAMGGLDALVFTAGVGEHSPEVRAATCEKLGFLGVQLDPEKNEKSPADQDISCAGSPVRVLIIHAQEDWAIAKACWEIARSK